MIRTFHNLATERSGAAAVEFALIAPVLFLLAVGTAQFGLTLANYVMLTEAVSSGARQLAVSRGISTPYSSTVSLMQSAAPTLSTMTITTTVNGTACATDTACSTALSTAAGTPATVTATYPCDLTVMGFNFAPNCTLSMTTAERIE